LVPPKFVYFFPANLEVYSTDCRTYISISQKEEMGLSKYPSDKLRNIGLIGHGGSGKTSIIESALFTAGATTRLGSVSNGTATTDYDPEEIKRKISINAAIAPAQWQNHKINFLDTPGYADFIGEVVGALRVVDSALVLVDAVAGVEVQTERVWHYADQNELPRLIFINKMDKENASFESTVEMAKEIFGDKLTPIQLPIGKEASFEGIVDLINMKATTYSDGKPAEGDIPAELQDQANEYREKLIDIVAEADDQMLEKYLEGEELTPDEIKKGLRAAILNQSVIPITCGSATKNIAASALLDTIVEYMPSAVDAGEVEGNNPKTNEVETRKLTESEPMSAFVFKTMADPYVGKLSYVRVYSGVLNPDSHILNATTGKKERIGHIFFPKGKNQEEAEHVAAGDIATIPKLAHTSTSDTLCADSKPIVFPAIKFPEPVFSVAVEPKTKGDEEKLSACLAKLADEDPTLEVRRDAEMKQTVASGIGDVQIEVVLAQLHRKFGVEATVSAPKIPYKETIRASSKAQGKYKKQTGGRGQYGDVWLEIEPLERGQGFEFVDKITGGAVPRQYVPAAEKGIIGAMEEGVIAGYAVVDVRATIFDGSFHPVDSSEMAFKIAGSMAFKKAVENARPALIEPIMDVEVVVPEKYMGDVIGDLSGKRGKILGMEARGRHQVVKAKVPLAEIGKYATQLRSITHGRGSYGMEFSHYEEVPSEVGEKIIAQSKEEKPS